MAREVPNGPARGTADPQLQGADMLKNEDVDGDLVSVLIGTYNGEYVVSETLESVLGQTYQPLEIIVVDDGSSDGTWDVLHSFGSRIRAIRQNNGGVASARNTALREAKGKFIALMDHDDLCEPERIAAQVALLRQLPEVVLCSTDFSAFDQNGPLANSYCGEYYSQCHSSKGGVMAKYPQRGSVDLSDCLPDRQIQPVVVPAYFGQVYENLALGNFVHPPTVLFRRSVLDEVGLFDEKARMMCDWDWLVRASRGGSFGFIDRPLLRYRRSDTQISSSRHHPRASIDSLHVAQRIVERDPDLYRRKTAEFKTHLGGMCLDAADANAEKDRWQSLCLLASSIGRYGTIKGQTFRTLLKILMPAILLNRFRQYRGRFVRTS